MFISYERHAGHTKQTYNGKMNRKIMTVILSKTVFSH
jgi:hypothetical protein